MELTRIGRKNLPYFKDFLPPWGAAPGQEALGLIAEDGCPCALAVVSGDEAEATVDWLFVHPDHRRRGAASFFLEKIEDLLAEEGIDSLSISYPAHIPGMDELLTANGYLVAEGDPICSIPLEDLRNSPRAKALLAMSGREEVVPLDALQNRERESLSRFLEEQYGSRAASLPSDPKLSLVALDAKRRVTCCLLLSQRREERVLFLSLLASRRSDLTAAVIGKALQRICGDPGLEGYKVRFISNSQSVDRLAGMLGMDLGRDAYGRIRYSVKALRPQG